MEEKKGKVEVFPIDIKEYPNEYSKKFTAGMYVESILVDPLTGVYEKWESTRYIMDSMPTARIFD